MCDPLEPRRFMTGSPLPLTGGSGDDGWYVRRNGTSLDVWSPIPSNLDSPGTPTNTNAISAVSEVNVTGNGGNDTLILDNRNGYVPVVPFHFSGGGDEDTVQLIGTTSADSYLYYDPGVGLPMVNGVYTDSELISLIPNGGGSPGAGDVIEVYGDFTGQTLVMAGDLGPYCDVVVDGAPAVRFDTSQHNGSILTLPLGTAKAGGDLVIRTALPSSMTGVTFDLNDNAMILDYAGTSPAATLRQYLVNGRNAGAWNGSNGIRSTTAAGDADHLHGIGYAEASELFGLSGTATADWHYNGGTETESVDATTLLARYTWLGDANLDGIVNAADFDLVRQAVADYAKLDPGTARDAFATWQHGNFNYDSGADSYYGFDYGIDSTDYDLMVDSYNAINAQSFATRTAITLGSGAYPCDLTGGTDEHAIVQQAIDDLADAGGGTLNVPGTVNLGSVPLHLISGGGRNYNNIHIRGTTAGAGFKLTGTPAAPPTDFQYGPGMILIEHATSVTITGLKLNGDGNNDGNGYAVGGVSLADTKDCVIDGNEITGGSGGIYAIGNRDNHYTHNWIHQVHVVNGIYAGNFWPDSSFTTSGQLSQVEGHPVIAFNDISGFLYGSTTNIGDGVVGVMQYATIVRNDINLGNAVTGNPGGHSGVKLSSANVTSGGIEYEAHSRDCVVLENAIDGAAWQGIQSGSNGDTYALDCTIKDNLISNIGVSGIYLPYVKGWTVAGNYIYNTAGAGIDLSLGGDDTVISYNHISNAGTANLHGGIYVLINEVLLKASTEMWLACI